MSDIETRIDDMINDLKHQRDELELKLKGVLAAAREVA